MPVSPVTVERVAGMYIWGSERIPVGSWVRPAHGQVDPDESGIVPACPDCGRIALLAVQNEKGTTVYREPTPATCAGPEHHDLT